jgi:hypothetical protein
MYGMKKNDYGNIVRYSKVDGPPDYAVRSIFNIESRITFSWGS